MSKWSEQGSAGFGWVTVKHGETLLIWVNVPQVAFPAKIIICMKIQRPDQCVCVFKERRFQRLFTDLSDIFDFCFFFFVPSPVVLFGDVELLKMLNAHCFRGDNTFIFYFLKLFLMAVKWDAVLCCIQLSSRRQTDTKKLNRSFHGWGWCCWAPQAQDM